MLIRRMPKETLLRTATFSPKVQTYWLLTGILISVLTVVGIPLLLIWIPLAKYFTGRYLANLSCLLKTRELIVRKGIFNRIEKTVPLEKITDLGLQQGPIMRYFGIHMLTVETAGQSSGGSLVSLTGIEDVEAFREAVLDQRDKITDREAAPPPPVAPDTVLEEIHKTLLRIEAHLKEGASNDSD